MNANAVARAFDISSKVNFILKNIYTARASSNGSSIRHESESWGGGGGGGGGSSPPPPPPVETFSVSKTLTLSQEHPVVCRKWMLLPAHS